MLEFHGFDFIVAVWGEAYTNLFLNVCLPTQLSPNNLQAFKDVEGTVYQIYTTAKDAETIVKHPAYSVLSEIMETQIKVFSFSDDFMKEYKHQVMNYCHQHSIVEANRKNSAVVFLIPDGAYADGLLKGLITLSQEGKQAVMLSSMRVTKETFLPEFHKLFNPNGNSTVISASPRQLVSLFLKHLHPCTKSLFWESKGSKSAWPSIILWDLGEEGVLVRQFHLHPLMVIPSRKDLLPSPTIDGEYISLVCENLDNVYVVEDSDDLYYCEISNRNVYPEHILKEGIADVKAVATWMKYLTDPLHRHCFKNFRLKHHVGDISPLWEKVQRESDEVVNEITNEFEAFFQDASAGG